MNCPVCNNITHIIAGNTESCSSQDHLFIYESDFHDYHIAYGKTINDSFIEEISISNGKHYYPSIKYNKKILLIDNFELIDAKSILDNYAKVLKKLPAFL